MRMMMSVLMFGRSSGAAMPSSRVNASIISMLLARRCRPICSLVVSDRAHVDDVPCERCRGGHGRTGQMSARARSLAADEVAVGGGDAALARRHRLVVHGEAHRAAG